MKTKLFTTLLFLLWTPILFGQVLNGTTWKLYATPVNIAAFVTFQNDTFIVDDLTTKQPFGEYRENDSLFTTWDFNPVSACQTIDTGTYSFEIVNDTLRFTKIYDECFVRVGNVTNFTWVRSQMAISEQNLEDFLTIYPNPSEGILIIKNYSKLIGKQLQFKNLIGQTVYIHPIETARQSLDVSFLPKGIYLISVLGFEKAIKLTLE